MTRAVGCQGNQCRPLARFANRFRVGGIVHDYGNFTDRNRGVLFVRLFIRVEMVLAQVDAFHKSL
ncbi:MAG: hypothetical protein BWX80_03445 [Candidatus Hydrogenedentes bacterium ADurb.Bin101]|nr:MAG: hypothetical protein BWX80_03445 [Candidatus Hydrogenedentes bacterium ADurb.Bin101]